MAGGTHPRARARPLAGRPARLVDVLRRLRLSGGRGLPRIYQPFAVFAPHNDLWEPTQRAAGLLPSRARFVELPHLGYEVFTLAADEMADLVRGFLDDQSA